MKRETFIDLQVYDSSGEIECLYREDFENDEIIMAANLIDIAPSPEYTKDGIVRGLQRYKRKNCNYRYIVAKKIDHKSAETKRLALELYLEGGEVNGYCSDYWKSYKKIIPREKHTPSKAETFTVEGSNA